MAAHLCYFSAILLLLFQTPKRTASQLGICG